MKDVEIVKIFGISRQLLHSWKNQAENERDWRNNLYLFLAYQTKDEVFDFINSKFGKDFVKPRDQKSPPKQAIEGKDIFAKDE